jgi:4-amino-4-deoxy-L-arabinose transferase-like glycosyltransferase
MIIQNKTVLFRTYNPGEAEKTYGQSQWQQSQNVAPDKARDEWAIQNKYTGWSDYVVANKDKVDIKKLSDQILASIGKKVVSDSFLYSYVGYKYINGTDPSLLNPEHPPLAKVLIGYSIKTFGNEHIIGIIIACITLILVGAISYQIYRSLLAASFAVFLTSFFSLFSDQIAHGPQLELYQLFFFLLVAQFLLMWKRKKNIIFCIGSGIFFGMLLSTKTFLPFFLLFSVWLIVALWKQWKALFIIFLFGAISFCLTYYSYFAHGGTLRTFLGLQKYIVTFYGHSSIPFFEFLGNNLRLIFTGSWKFWDTARSVSTYSEWNLLWPIIFLIGMYKLKIQWTKYNNSHILIWFVILYNIFVFVIPIFPRYLLLLFVPLIILI